VEDLKSLFLFEIMARCPYLGKICVESDSNVGSECENNEYLDRGCYKGFVNLAFSRGLEESVLPDIPGIGVSPNPFNN